MRRSRVAATAAALVAGVVSIGGATVTEASVAGQSADLRTMRFVSQTFAESGVGRYRFVGADEVRRSGEVIGYNSYTGRYFPARDRVVIRVGVALRGGVIMGRVAADAPREGEATVFRGPILGGSGRYDGIRGRIVARIAADDTEGRAHVTLRWRT